MNWTRKHFQKGRRLSTVYLLVKVACLMKNENNIFNIKMSWYKLAWTRRSTVLSLALQQEFPGLTLPHFLNRNKELASQDLARKLQRQLRDLREDFATTQQKETEANAKKNELVTASLDFFSS
jgi:hypothetical protein